MHPDVEEIRPKLKEVLYDCAVEIRATKAALYLFDGSSLFELVTQFGFRGGIRATADFNDPLVDRCGRGRNAFFVNGVASEPRFSELLFEASTDRILAAPVYAKGKLIGLIDMRDKPGRQPFDGADVAKAQHIADRMAELLVEKEIFGHRFLTLSKFSGLHLAVQEGATDKIANIRPEPPIRDVSAPPPPPPRSAFTPAVPRAAPPPPGVDMRSDLRSDVRSDVRTHVPRLATLVLDARAIAGRILVAAPESFGENELIAVREVLRSLLLIPASVAAMFSAFGHLGGVQEIAARSSLNDDTKDLLQSRLNVWLSKRGVAGGVVRTSVLTPFGTSAPPVAAAHLQKVFTAPVAVGAMRGLYLTVAFSATPDRTAHELLGVLHAHLQLTIEQSLQHGAASSLQLRIAERLIEPDFAKYPELRRHSDAVSALCESFCRHLALTPAEAETTRIVALVHDAGMRLLDYDRLYRKRNLTPEELGFLREHPSVGAAIVEPLLGPEIARAVLCHHERADGHGYPNELPGGEIPLPARIVQICDAWAAMTDPDGYQKPTSPPNALAAITHGAGTQFDAGLATRFVEMMRGK